MNRHRSNEGKLRLSRSDNSEREDTISPNREQRKMNRRSEEEEFEKEWLKKRPVFVFPYS